MSFSQPFTRKKSAERISSDVPTPALGVEAMFAQILEAVQRSACIPDFVNMEVCLRIFEIFSMVR